MNDTYEREPESGALLRRDQRVAILVDVQNMFYSAKNIYDKKINFERLLEQTSQRRAVIRALAYVVETPEIDQSAFLSFLRDLGFEIRSKQLKVRGDGTTKGDWDMGIAIDAIALGDRVDVIALVSGDGDFVDLVEMLKARGVRVEVYSFPSSTADELKKSATAFYTLDADVLLVE